MTDSTTQTQTSTSFDLVLPPDPELLRVVRLVASAVASLTTLPIDAVEGLRVAADELVSTLIQAAASGTVTVTFERDADHIAVLGRVEIDPSGGFELDPLTDRILDTVVTSHSWETRERELHGRVEQSLPPD